MWPFGPFFRRHGDTVNLKTDRPFLPAKLRLEPGGSLEIRDQNRVNPTRGPMGREFPEVCGTGNVTADADGENLLLVYFLIWLQAAFPVHATDFAEWFRHCLHPGLKTNSTSKVDSAFPDGNLPLLSNQGGLCFDARGIARAGFAGFGRAPSAYYRPENSLEETRRACAEMAFLSIRNPGLLAAKSFEITLKAPWGKIHKKPEEPPGALQKKNLFGGFYLEIVNDIVEMYVSLLSCAKKGKWGLGMAGA